MTRAASSANLFSRLKAWWQTDCAVCLRLRLYLIWALLMLLVYFYVWN